MNRRAVEVAIIALSVTFVVALALERDAAHRAHPPSTYSTYDTGPNGYRALYEVLRAAGVGVKRFERVLGVLDPSVRTLVITGYENDPSAKPLDDHDAAYLRSFVQRGGRLVAIDAEFAGPDDVAPGVGTTLQTPGRDAVVLGRNAYTQGVSRVGGPIGWTFPFKEPRGIPLLANAHGMVAVLYREGRGEVVAIAAPELFGNARLRNADNVRFAYNAIAGHGDAVFDEYVHGYDDNLSLWGALPGPVRSAVWIAVAIVLLGLIGANVPFAPAFLPTPPDERDSSHYIAALAELMSHSRNRPYDFEVVGRAIAAYNRRKEHA